MKRFLTFLLLLSLLLSGCECKIPAQTAPSSQPESAPAPDQGSLTVHYIDVGQADAILLECDGEYMLIDGGDKADSQLMVAYLANQGVEELAAVVCTHPHEDHVGGLPAVLAVYPTRAVYAAVETWDLKVYDDFLRYAREQGLEVTVPELGFEWMLGSTRITVVGPVKSYAETNNSSLVLLAEYGSTRFLFTGDMESLAESDMLDHWEGKLDWDVDVLKIGHHGSDTSSGYRFVYETQPEYGIISVGSDNAYGHPDDKILKRFADAGTVLFRTDRLGAVVARSDGETVTLTWENGRAKPENAIPDDSIVFIANRKSGVFHSSECGSLPKESNRIYFDSYLEALEAGYTPCGGCLGK